MEEKAKESNEQLSEAPDALSDINLETELKEVQESQVPEEQESEEKEDKPLSLQEQMNLFLINERKIQSSEIEKKETIPTGVDLLDAILGGGVALGALTVFVGEPGSFKSALAAKCIAACQKKFKGRFLAHYVDTEHSTTTVRLKQLGVTNPPIKPKSGYTLERLFELIESLCLFKIARSLEDVPAVVVWDSIVNTVCQKELEVDDINKVIGLRQRILSWLLAKYVIRISEFNISIVAVNQLRDKLDMQGYATPPDLKYMTSNKVMPGGNAVKFNAFQLVELKQRNLLDENQYGFPAIMIEAKCVKNKLFTPNIPITMIAKYDTGISNFWTNMFLLKDCKLATFGSWCSISGHPAKFRKKEAEELYKSDESFRVAFDELVKQAIKVHYIDKYRPIFEAEIKENEEGL